MNDTSNLRRIGDPVYDEDLVNKGYLRSSLNFPVGYIIEVDNADFNPNIFYSNGLWTRIKGKVIVGVDEDDNDFKTNGLTLGSKFLEEHSHPIYPYNDDFNNSSAGQPYGTTTDGSYNKYSNTVFKTETAGTGHSGNIQPSYTAYMWKVVSYK